MHLSNKARWAVAFLVILPLLQRIVALACLLWTFVSFAVLPFPVLGTDDGFNLPAFTAPPGAPEVVPRILHQVRLGGLAMKPSWTEAREACLSVVNSTSATEEPWKVILWEDETADAFVKEFYPHLFELYRGYGQEIQRSNAIRYMILNKMGGIYLDLDVKCKVGLEPFLTQSFVSPPGVPLGINNAFMASTKGNPFMQFAVDRLEFFNINWGSLYITDMFSTGCHYISTMHALYPQRNQLKVLPREYKLGGVSHTPIFDHLGAASWHKGDANFIKKVGDIFDGGLRHPWWVAQFGMVIAVAVVGVRRWRSRVREAAAAAGGARDQEKGSMANI